MSLPPRSTLRAVLFDLDGVLIDSGDLWYSLMEAAAVAFGCPPLGRDAFDASFGQGMDEDSEQFYPGHPAEELCDYYLAHHTEHLPELRVEPGAVELFAGLREADTRIAVVTNTPTEMARTLLGAAGLEADTVIGSGGEVRDKPAPDMLRVACARLGVFQTETVMVGDSRWDELAACNAGIPFVGFRRDGDVRIESLPELIPLLDGAVASSA